MPDGERGHALVVGGTGMLAAATLALARDYRVVSVIARNRDRLQDLAARLHRPPGGEQAAGGGPWSGIINPIALDYRDTAALRAALQDAVRQHGPIELAVCWIHRTAPAAPAVVAAFTGTPERPGRFFHVQGSVAADPARAEPGQRAALEQAGPILYREVILGFVIEEGRSRWLTHREISEGVLEAIRADRPRFIVGTVRPWSARP